MARRTGVVLVILVISAALAAAVAGCGGAGGRHPRTQVRPAAGTSLHSLMRSFLAGLPPGVPLPGGPPVRPRSIGPQGVVPFGEPRSCPAATRSGPCSLTPCTVYAQVAPVAAVVNPTVIAVGPPGTPQGGRRCPPGPPQTPSLHVSASAAAPPAQALAPSSAPVSASHRSPTFRPRNS